MTSSYFQSLDEVGQDRYAAKLFYKGQILPDPLDEEIQQRGYHFSNSYKFWPPLFICDMYTYLTETECSYTMEEFRHKELPCYNYIQSGKVNNVKCYRNSGLQVCILICTVQESHLNSHYPWVSITMTGEILNGHCTCMTGIGVACSHVAALLMIIENESRKQDNNPSPLSGKRRKISKKVPPARVIDIDFGIRGRVKKQELPVVKPPSKEEFGEFVKGLRKLPNCRYLALIGSDEDISTASEEKQESAGDK